MSATSPDRLLQRRAAIVGAVLLLFVAAGAVLLWPSGTRPDLVVAPEPGPLTLSKGAEVAVLRIRSGRRPTSVGRGLALGDGRIEVHAFRGIDVAELPTSGLLLRADLAAMWQVASDAQRDAVRAAAISLASDSVTALDDILGSPAFVTRYRPLLNEIFSDAIGTAWLDPETQAALATASRTSQQIGLSFLVEDLRPVLMERAPAAVWRTLGANLSTGFGLFSSGLETRPIAEALDEVMRDETVVEGLKRATRRIAGSPEVETFARALARSTARALNRDPQLQRVLVDVFRDPAFSPQLRRIAASGVALLDAAQTQIAGLGGSREMNALAATVFRGLIRGQEELVLVLTTDLPATAPVMPVEKASP